jgi:thiol-disulfide isomerase/thioredoxin
MSFHVIEPQVHFDPTLTPVSLSATVSLSMDNARSLAHSSNARAPLTYCLVKAEWCGHCRAYKPLYEEVARKYPENVFYVIDNVYLASMVETSNVDDETKRVFTALAQKTKGYPSVFIWQNGTWEEHERIIP